MIRLTGSVGRVVGCSAAPLLGELPGQNEFRSLVRQAIDADRINDPLRKFLAEMPQVGFETPHHHSVEFARPHRDATCKALRVEDFEQA